MFKGRLKRTDLDVIRDFPNQPGKSCLRQDQSPSFLVVRDLQKSARPRFIMIATTLCVLQFVFTHAAQLVSASATSWFSYPVRDLGG